MSDRLASLLRAHHVAITAQDLATPGRPQAPTRCGHCGGSQLYRDEDGGFACLRCGWRGYLDRLPADVARREVEGRQGARYQGPDVRERLLAALRSGPLTVPEAEARLSASREAVHAGLAGLVREGSVVRERDHRVRSGRRGWYRYRLAEGWE